MVFSPWSTIVRRTTAWPWRVHGQAGLGPVCAWKPSPSTNLSRFSTSGVQDPQDAAALVTARTCSKLDRPCSAMAAVIVPLHTPLQSQTSSLSAMAATAALGSRPRRPSVIGAAEHQGVADLGDVRPWRIRSKYQAAVGRIAEHHRAGEPARP